MLVAVSVSHGAKFEGGNNWGKHIFVLPNEMNDSLMFNTNIYSFFDTRVRAWAKLSQTLGDAEHDDATSGKLGLRWKDECTSMLNMLNDKRFKGYP